MRRAAHSPGRLGRAGAVLAAAALLCAACGARAEPSEPELPVAGVAFASGTGAGGAALAAVVRGALAARGVRARVEPAPAACAAPDAPACLRAVLAALARGALAAALVPAARAPAAPLLRAAGLEELGDAAPPAHRACFALPPADADAGAGAAPLRSLLELADARLAGRHALPAAALRQAARALAPAHAEPRFEDGNSTEAPLATVLVPDAAEEAVLSAVIAEHGLRARAAVLPGLAGAAARQLRAALAPRGAVLCARAPDAAALAALGARALAPPPCLAADCPFEARRLLKLVDARALARSPSARAALAALELSERELRALEAAARAQGADAAAAGPLRAHGGWAGAAPEVRVAVMVPGSTRRDTWAARALAAAAELAERDEAALEFKAELLDAGCSGERAFKYLTDALGSEFGALAAVAGPACGAAFADVARQGAALALPLLAYTPQAAPGGAALLAAGDARQEPAALAAVLARLGWRRAAVLSELGARAALAPARLAPQVLVHVELPGGEAPHGDLVRQWVARAAAERARVLYLAVEDGRCARAALCAGRAAGLVPRAGAVWLAGAALPPGWLRRKPGDEHACSDAELAAAAEGHLAAAPAWAADWRAPAAWAARWRALCARGAGGAGAGAGAGACGAPPPAAGALYDALRLWARALAVLLRADPAAADDLHREDRVRFLMEEATREPYQGVTGELRWEPAGSGRARAGGAALLQWRNGSYERVGEWRGGELRLGALRWGTEGGAAPDDGAERCALQGLADALRADCRAAHAAAAAAPGAALAALLAAGAWRWRRRARRERGARLAALGMRALAKAAPGPDRWEVPRERVVINRKLGTGAFGTVYGGHALLRDAAAWTAVAVKTLKAGASTEERLDFLAEAEAMKRLEHQNVVRLLGVVTASEPVCTVMEFVLHGDLKSYLAARRHLAGGRGAAAGDVAPARLTRMALDVARALAYLARMRFVHRDVAARNCLVSAQRVVKLADFGMTRVVFEHDYYRLGRAGLLPVRWMAPESLARGVFSPASDVWALGVLLYEVITFGALPFRGLGNAQVLARVRAGRPLDLPPGLKPQLEGLIKSCWQLSPRARPSAAAVAAFLADAPRLLSPCLDVPLDGLPLPLDGLPLPLDDLSLPLEGREPAEAGWPEWHAPGPPSPGTDSTYLSAEAAPAPRETDAFLPRAPPDLLPV